MRGPYECDACGEFYADCRCNLRPAPLDAEVQAQIRGEKMGMRETQLARHRTARHAPLKGYERSLGNMREGWKEYAEAREIETGEAIVNDGYVVEPWGAIGYAIKALLNCEHGALDGGEMCKEVNETAKRWGVTDLERYW